MTTKRRVVMGARSVLPTASVLLKHLYEYSICFLLIQIQFSRFLLFGFLPFVKYFDQFSTSAAGPH
ncbi:hypothetical protein BJX63DRAFT_390095 [Aspergillus granulosus]|uniref:Uncharacterized protein n=1 Tax=Aspergillus granulosus TaxID=176169 RepID=A0ABR4HIL0_9EURO